MNIVIKKIKYYESLSQETLAFNANLYIEGKRAELQKDGRGGTTYYYGR